MTLSGIIQDVEAGYYPRQVDGKEEENAPTWFNEDDEDHLRAFYDRVMDCGLSFRVTMGYEVMTADRNRIIDPEEDCLELHPRIIEGLRSLDNPLKFWLGRLWRGIAEILKEGWNL